MGKNQQAKSRKDVDIGTGGFQIQVWMAVIFLCIFGLLMVYSASSYQCSMSAKYQYNSMYLFYRQGIYMGLGIVACLIFQYVHYDILYTAAGWIYFLALGCIGLLLTPWGVSANGATRWVNLMGIQFQVAEIVKIGVILGLGYMVQRYHRTSGQIKLTLYMWCMGGGAALLIKALSNDLSSAIVILGITVGITFIFTDTMKLHLITGGGAVSVIAAYVIHLWRNLPTEEELSDMSFRVGRMAAWLKPEQYMSDAGYQTLQALYAIGRGGVFGQGLGQSIQKLSALPEAQNDMIFAILCEELGAFGAMMLIGLFVYLSYYLCKIASEAGNLFGAVLTVGVLLHISLQTIINISVNLNLIPNTGIGLPFISYGGTAVFCQLVEMAIILSVTRSAGGCGVLEFYRIKEKGGKRKGENER